MGNNTGTLLQVNNRHENNSQRTKSTQTEFFYFQHKQECIICMDKLVTELIFPCGHVCLCRICSETLIRNSNERSIDTVTFRRFKKTVVCPLCLKNGVIFTCYN